MQSVTCRSPLASSDPRTGPLHHRLGLCLAVTATALLATSDVDAQSQSALDFDGIDDYVEMGGPLDFNAPFTVEAWILARSGKGGGRFISTRVGANGWEMDVAEAETDTYLRFTFGCCARAIECFEPYMNTWTHVAGTWDGPAGASIPKLYIDGMLVDEGFQPEDLAPSGTNLLLGWDGFGDGHFDGRIDEVRVWSAELDQPTIAAWMRRHATPDHPNFSALVAAWRLNEGSGQTVVSDVNSPTMDGRLGGTTGDETTDPAWVPSEVVPTRETSVGGLKARFCIPSVVERRMVP